MEDEYRRLLEEIRDAYFVVQEGKIAFINDRYAEVHGYGKEELLDMPVSVLLEPSSHEIATELYNRKAAGFDVPQRYQVISVAKDGTRFPVEVSYWDTSYKGRSATAGTITDVTERIRRYSEAVRSLEEEKKRLALALHDDTIQELLVVCHRLHDIGTVNGGEFDTQAQKRLADIRNLVELIIENLRSQILNLRPAILDDLGLIPALRWLTSRLSTENGINTKISVTGKEQCLHNDIELALFRIAQEALTNIRKHAEASRAMVKLEFKERKIVMSIIDNGKGFDPPVKSILQDGQVKLGLTGMNERTNLLSGVFQIRSNPGKGTAIKVDVPIQASK